MVDVFMLTNLNRPASKTNPWLNGCCVGTTVWPNVSRIAFVKPGKNIFTMLSSVLEFFVIKTVWSLRSQTSTDWLVKGKVFGWYDLKSNEEAVMKARDSRVMKLPLSSC